MKRIWRGLLLALLLAALSSSAMAQTLVSEGLCTFTYPDNWEDFGADSSYDEEGRYYNLGYIGGSRYYDLNVSVDLYYYEDFADMRLFSADSATLRDYAHSIESSFYEVQSSEIIEAGEYGIPFVVVHGVDQDGECLYANTIANGWCISLCGFAYADRGYRNLRELTEEDEQVFRAIIESFEPILEGSDS